MKKPKNAAMMCDHPAMKKQNAMMKKCEDDAARQMMPSKRKPKKPK